MENRRQQAMQRKAEEEKARAEEEEKRIKEEIEKRKREREEHTGKLPIPKALKKVCLSIRGLMPSANVSYRQMMIRWANGSSLKLRRRRKPRSRSRRTHSLVVP